MPLYDYHCPDCGEKLERIGQEVRWFNRKFGLIRVLWHCIKCDKYWFNAKQVPVNIIDSEEI